MASLSAKPSIVNFLEILSSGGDDSIRLEAVSIQEDSQLIGKTLRESNIGQFTGAIIIGILNSEGTAKMNLSSMASLSSIMLQEGDELLALGNDEQIKNLNSFAN